MPVDPIRRRALERARKYGLAFEDALLADDVRWCQATGRPLLNGGHMDHDHHTGKARGVLDPVVNRALAAGLTPEDLRRMAAYLERTSAPNFDWGRDRRQWLRKHGHIT